MVYISCQFVTVNEQNKSGNERGVAVIKVFKVKELLEKCSYYRQGNVGVAAL